MCCFVSLHLLLVEVGTYIFTRWKLYEKFECKSNRLKVPAISSWDRRTDLVYQSRRKTRTVRVFHGKSPTAHSIEFAVGQIEMKFNFHTFFFKWNPDSLILIWFSFVLFLFCGQFHKRTESDANSHKKKQPMIINIQNRIAGIHFGITVVWSTIITASSGGLYCIYFCLVRCKWMEYQHDISQRIAKPCLNIRKYLRCILFEPTESEEQPNRFWYLICLSCNRFNDRFLKSSRNVNASLISIARSNVWCNWSAACWRTLFFSRSLSRLFGWIHGKIEHTNECHHQM